MIVRANQPLMRGAQLTPVRRNGLHVVPRKRRGLGDAANISGLVSSYSNSFLYSLGANMEQGNAATPDVVAQTLTSAVANACADQVPGTACDPSSVQSQIAAAVAAYTAAYNAAKANTQAMVSAGAITAPPAYFSANPTVVASPVNNYVPGVAPAAAAPAATVPFPTSARPVQSNAPRSGVALVPPGSSGPATVVSPTVVQSNSPAPGVVLPTDLNISDPIPDQNWFMSESIASVVPNWMVLVVGGGIAWLVFKR